MRVNRENKILELPIIKIFVNHKSNVAQITRHVFEDTSLLVYDQFYSPSFLYGTIIILVASCQMLAVMDARLSTLRQIENVFLPLAAFNNNKVVIFHYK